MILISTKPTKPCKCSLTLFNLDRPGVRCLKVDFALVADKKLTEVFILLSKTYVKLMVKKRGKKRGKNLSKQSLLISN